MFWRKLMGAAVVLAVLAGASWLPAPADHALPASTAPTAGWARPAMEPPTTWPVAATDPVQAVRGFFWSLGIAVAGQHGSRLLPGTASEGLFSRAYAYLAPGWQQRLPFADFLRRWSLVRHLDLLAVLPAGAATDGPSHARVFVEVRQLSADGDGATPLCLCFAYAFFTTSATPHGVRLSAGQLTPEDFAPAPAGAQTADAAATAAARSVAAARGWSGGPSGAVRLTPRPHHQATADVAIGDHAVTVHLYELASGAWIVLRSSV